MRITPACAGCGTSPARSEPVRSASPANWLGRRACPPQSAVALAGDADVLDRAETSLCSRRARRALELSLPLLREGLQRFSVQAENGWRDQLRGEAWEAAHNASPGGVTLRLEA